MTSHTSVRPPEQMNSNHQPTDSHTHTHYSVYVTLIMYVTKTDTHIESTDSSAAGSIANTPIEHTQQ